MSMWIILDNWLSPFPAVMMMRMKMMMMMSESLTLKGESCRHKCVFRTENGQNSKSE